MKRIKYWRSIVLVVLLIGAVFGGWYFSSQSIKVSYPQAWDDWRDKLQDAATEYSNANNGSLPILGSGAVIVDGNEQYLMDICLLKQLKLVPYPPENCISLPGVADDNCDGGNCSCHESAHYIWTLDTDGIVHSACTGEQCGQANADGYQGVWP